MSTVIAPIIAGFDSFALIREKDDFSIWRARLIENGLTVEIIVANEGASPSILNRLFAVYEHIRAMAHPNVYRVIDINRSAPSPYIVTEHLIGRSLYSIVKEHGPFESHKALRFARQIGLALDHLNSTRHFAIRNLKPDNIRLDDAGNVKLCDFTLAILPNESGNGIDAEDEGSVVGTPQYISPEQATASPSIDFRTDFYSLGAILYYLTTGVIPFDMPDVMKILELQASGALPDPRTIKAEIMEDFVSLISFLMIKNPDHRYKSWSDVVADIKNIEFGRKLNFEPPIGAVSTIHKIQSSSSSSNAEGEGKPKKSFSQAITPPFWVRVVLWVALLVWLIWLADARIGSTMNLPGSRNLAYLIDKTLQDYNESVSCEEVEEAQEVTPIVVVEETSRPEVESKPDEPLPVEEPQGVEAESSVPPQEAASVSALEESNKAMHQIPQWGSQVMEQLRKGNFKEAIRIADLSKSMLGMEVSSVLAKMPQLDEAVAAQIMKKKGQDASIVYMGRTRILVPMKCMSGTIISASFNNRIVRFDVAQFSQEEKLRWLKDAEDEGTNARALALALQLVDDAAIMHHASRAGALSKLFSK